MSKWSIYHKDGSVLTDANGEQIDVHELEYSDSWMGECFVTVSFKHNAPINFQIGDYLEYRGERFELNYDPGKEKQARKDSYGEAFVYDSVKFNALQDELTRTEFLDVVLSDNELHYTALPKFSFYVETLDDLLDRVQANLNEQIGDGKWKIFSRNKGRSEQRGCTAEEWNEVYGEGTADITIESKSITVDTKKCWEALALTNSEWDVNFIVRGRNVYVGTAGVPTANIFKYGLGNGLYKVDQNADSDQSIITRLRAYGSDQNLPSHYYADLGIKYKCNITSFTATECVELLLDLDYIETYFTNPRTFTNDGETISLGWVLQVTFDYKTIITGYVTEQSDTKKCRFYSEYKGDQIDSGDEPSKENLDAFIAQVKEGNTLLYITSGVNKDTIPYANKEYADNLPNNMAISRLMLPGFPHLSLKDYYDTLSDTEKAYVNPNGKEYKFSTDKYRPYIDSPNIDEIGLRSGSQFFDTDDKTNGVIAIYPTIEEMEIGGVRVDEINEGVAPDDDGRYDGTTDGPKKVDIYLSPSIDFDISDLKNDDFAISMKDGMCGGKTFNVAATNKVDGRWRLTIERAKDDALDLYFPYKDYPIKKGDHFVLTGIDLPDSYVNAASLKLLKYALALLDKNDYTRYVYQPKVDELFMARQHDEALNDDTNTIKSLHDTLKAGDIMLFEDEDLGIDAQISIDHLTIKEGSGNIPTYEITLREDKEVGTIQKIQQQISSLTSGNGGSGGGATTSQVKGIVTAEGSKYFLSKLLDDTAQGIITLLKGLKIGDGGNNQITAEGLAQLYAFMTYNFQAGFYGTGAQIDHTGNAELDSLFVRKFISTPKFVYNEVAVTKAEQWNTNGFGTIESVDLETQQITLKLEENDYGSLAVGDICRGIFADIGNVYGSDKITEGAQDDCNFVQHKGFFTAYFYVKRIITSEQGKFVFEYGKKSESTPDPCAYMDFAQYGSFTDEQRRSSMYFCSRGRSYIEVLDGVDTWVIAPEHRVARYGWLGGLRITKEDGTYRTLDGNGLFAQNNVYFGGTVEFLQGLSGLDDLIKQRESYDVSLSQYQSVLTVDDMGNVINGLYTEDEAETMKQYRVSTAVFVRRGQEILLEEDDDVEDVTEGHYRLYVVSDDCEVKIQNSTIFVTGIKNVKDGVAGTDDDADFDYDAMRQMTDAMVTIVVDLEGKTSKTVQMPIRIQHDSLPFMVCDLSNEHAGVAWNTKTGKYVGFPIETQVNLYYQNTPHEISELTATCPTGMTATVEKTDGKITGKITITGDNLTEDTLEQVSEVRITAVGVYAGARYEYTKTLTVTKSADTVVYEVVPSVDSIVVDKNGGKSADTLTCAVYATSSDDKRYQLDALPTGFVLKYGLGDTATTAMALGDTVTVGDAKQVTFALFDASGNILDREGVPVLAYGKDGKGIEYIYKRTKDNTKPTNPTPSDWETNADYQSQETEYIPTGWTDDPTGVDAVYVYEWVCVRTSTNGKWGTFSDPAEYAHFGKHAPSARCSDDIVTIPTDSDGNALDAFSETLTFDLLVDGRACTLTGVDKYSSTLSNVTCSISSYKATISCSNNAGLGRVAQTIVFAVTGTLDGASYTDYVTVKVLPNVTGADGDGYEYVYYLSSSATAPSAPSRTGGTLTSGWVDDPPALTDTKRYIYVAYKMGVIGGDGAFGTPRLWAYKAKDGEKGVGTVTAYQRSESALTSTPTITDYATFKTRGDLGNGWTKSVPAISDVSANNNTSGGDWSTATDGGYSWYKSPTVSASGIATMQIYFTTAAAGQYVTFYLKAYSEASYDYVLISELDSTSLTRTSGYSARTSGNGVETSVKLKCATAGQHYVTVAYAKDGSGDKNGDYGLVRIDTSGLLYCCDGAVVDGAIAWGTPYQVEGEKGDQGEKGETGNGVASVTVCYAISASNTEAPTSGWSTSMVNPTSAKPYLWSKTVTTYTNGSSDESTPVVIGNFAEQGPKGTNGCIVRQSDWTSGVEYHNDSALTTDGVKYIDVVYVENSSSNYGYDQYQCAKSHTSSSSLTYTNTEYWTKLSDVNPIYTPLIIAKNAVLKFAQTNQLLVMKSDGSTVNVGLGGGDYPLWIGAATATAAAFKVNANGKLYAAEAVISGNITADSGKIGGFTISENGLTHIIDGSMGTAENLGYIICRNDYYGRFAGIGASILPATSGGVSAVARFSNTDTKSLFSTNIALMLSAENGDMGNFAFYGKGNGVLDGWTGGFKLTKITPPTASGIDSGLLSFKENNTFIIYNVRNGAGVALPRLNIIAEELGLSTLSIPNFCVHITVCSDISSLSSNNWKLYGRCNVKSSSGTYPWNDSTNPYPVLVDENASQVDSIEMGPGDTVELLLIYDSSQSKTYTIGSTSVTAKYTARLIHRRS